MSSGLTVRWSLTDAPEGVEQSLADYVRETSHPRFEGMVGLAFKTWRLRAGEWFEGCYVFVDDAARTVYQGTFTDVAAESPVSKIVGSSPVLIEEWVVLGVAEGKEKFGTAPSYDVP